jgi:hypothetical protein
MSVALVAGPENIPVIGLNDDTGRIIIPELFQLLVKTLSASDDSGNKIRHGLPFHRHPGLESLDGVISRREGLAD